MTSQQQRIENAVSIIIDALNYDIKDQHFKRTPERVAEMLLEFSKPDESKAEEILQVQFTEKLSVNSLVLVERINFTSYCAHHLSLISGLAWVGYLPDKHICGLSKLARLVRLYSRQMAVQEVVTEKIVNALDEYLKPKGVMVVVRAKHACMGARGIAEPETLTTTSAIRGVFFESEAARAEFLSLINGR